MIVGVERKLGAKELWVNSLWMDSWMVAGLQPAGSSDGMASSRVSELVG